MTDLSDGGLEKLAELTFSLIKNIGDGPREPWICREAQKLILETLKSVHNERLVTVLPSEDDAFAWARNYYNERGVFPSPKSVYLWLRANLKAIVVHHVSDEELKSLADAAHKEHAEDSYLEDYKNGFQHGYRAALKHLLLNPGVE